MREIAPLTNLANNFLTTVLFVSSTIPALLLAKEAGTQRYLKYQRIGVIYSELFQGLSNV